MDSTILASIIGGACTIAAVIIPKIIEDHRDPKIPAGRQDFLKGTWKGTIVQSRTDDAITTMQMELNLEIKRRKIVGTGVLFYDEQLHHITLCGIFRNDRFLKMDYDNKLSHLRQFGCFLFDLDKVEGQLTGRFVGYGHISRNIVYGTCSFKKA